MIGLICAVVGAVLLAFLVAALLVCEIGNPILIIVSSLLVAQNTWAFRNGKSMFFGIGAYTPDAGGIPRTIKLAGMWVMYIGFLAEQAYSLIRLCCANQ
ncbi:hypothetical protein [Roseateles sp. LKC17W]|uniref:Uncharacterized protein n=1 Tax=Pelomonas margarita TaxID=3299031 RepID=A0ABW7FGY1_9BURK